jgi:hypothetical protein
VLCWFVVVVAWEIASKQQPTVKCENSENHMTMVRAQPQGYIRTHEMAAFPFICVIIIIIDTFISLLFI